MLSCFTASLRAAITQVALGASPESPQVLGTPIQLTASALDSDPGPMSYKWEVQAPGFSDFSLMRDFDQENTFTWVPTYSQGTYHLRLTVRDHLAGTRAETVVTFQVHALATGDQPVVVPTTNPLVALFSAPSCPAGSTMSVVFQRQGSTTQHVTDERPCHSGTMSFYIAGMLQTETYTMYSQVTTGSTVVPGPQVLFTTGAIPTSLSFAARSTPVPPGPQTGLDDGIVFTAYDMPPDFPTATDLHGHILWYYPTPLQVTRPVPGGTVLMIPNGLGTGTGVWGPNVTRQQLLREIDLAGNTIRETNCDRVYEQLQALGLTDALGRFNHDALRLANGQTIVVGDVQRIFPAGTQGSTTPIDVVGAVTIVLDKNFQVIKYWNAFDHDCAGTGCLDINRPGSTKCVTNGQGQTSGGCPPVLLSSPANDWLHANSLEYLPTDGDLLLSLRSQDWIVKIDYNNGLGTGGILWRLGVAGDFAVQGAGGDPYPWFSGQHNPGFVNDGETTLVVFDNGTGRHAKYGGNSRGQVWNIDQTNMIATRQLNVDLGAYSKSLGSAEQLLNGDYAFLAGNINISGKIETQNTEVSPHGTVNYELQTMGPSQSYRGWRLKDFYHATLNGAAGPE